MPLRSFRMGSSDGMRYGDRYDETHKDYYKARPLVSASRKCHTLPRPMCHRKLERMDRLQRHVWTRKKNTYGTCHAKPTEWRDHL